MSASTADIVNNYCNVDQMSDPMTDEATAAVISIKDDVGGTPKRKRKREKRPPDPSDPAVIAAAAAIQTAKIEAEQALLAAQEEAAIPTPMENCKYYTSLGKKDCFELGSHFYLYQYLIYNHTLFVTELNIKNRQKNPHSFIYHHT